MGLWGFSFALGAMANTGAHLIVAGRLAELGWSMFIFGSALIVLLWCGTLCRIATSIKAQPVAVEK